MGGAIENRIVVLSSSLLVDRMLVHTDFLETLSRSARAEVWATSASGAAANPLWQSQPATVRALPAVRSFREYRHNYLRRLNETVWDLRQREPSRISMLQHRPPQLGNLTRSTVEAAARALARFPVERAIENVLEPYLLRYERSPEATERLTNLRPAVIVATGPFQFEQPAIVASAKRLGVKVLGLIPSWDNVSTKRRMLFRYDGYIVWSEQMKRELQRLYPHTRTVPVYVVGAPQFDVFFQPRFVEPREAFCARQSLAPGKPIILYAVGSPNFLHGEPAGALKVARAVAAGELGDVQLLVRPHPIHDNAELESLFGELGPRVRLQRTSRPGTPLTSRSQDAAQVADWVNTFRHAAVVVNLSSTVTIDAALYDRPIVNLDFDPGPGAVDDQLVKDINHRWTHFKPIAESGGVWLANNHDEVCHAIRTYLTRPELHREARQWIVNHVCQFADGRCGQRMAEAILDFVDRQGNSGREPA